MDELNPNPDNAARVRRNAAMVGAGVLGFIVLLIVLVGTASSSNDSQSRLIGTKGPTIAGISLSGEAVSSADSDGWVVLNFFALWCPGCIAEHPELVELSEWGKDNNNLEIIGVVYDSTDFEEIAQFFRDNGGDWPVIDNPAIASDYAVARIPETFVIDPDGVVVKRFQGEVTSEEVIEVVESDEAS